MFKSDSPQSNTDGEMCLMTLILVWISLLEVNKKYSSTKWRNNVVVYFTGGWVAGWTTPNSLTNINESTKLLQQEVECITIQSRRTLQVRWTDAVMRNAELSTSVVCSGRLMERRCQSSPSQNQFNFST